MRHEITNENNVSLCCNVCPPQQVVLCKSLRDTSSRLAELGWLHNKVRKYTDARSLDRAFGLVGQVPPTFFPRAFIMSSVSAFLHPRLVSPPPQSFCASLHQELKEYYRLLSVLHSQVQTRPTEHRQGREMTDEQINDKAQVGRFSDSAVKFRQTVTGFTFIRRAAFSHTTFMRAL